MEIGRSRAVGGILAGLLICAPAAGAVERETGIWKILRDGRFSGAMNEDARVEPIPGSITAKGKRYRLMAFGWEESEKNMRGSTPHAQYRLLVFEQTNGALSYLGSYIVDGEKRPKIQGKSVFYPYKDIEILGVKVPKEIPFENGPPPSAIGPAKSDFFR